MSLYMITGNWELLQYFTSIEYYWWHCFSPPQVLCLPLVTPPTLCLPWNYRPTSYRNTGSRGAWPCCVPSTTNCLPQRLWSVVHTCDVFVLHVLVLVDSEGCGLGGDGGHFLTTRMPIVGFLLPLYLVMLIPSCTYKKSVIKTWWFLHC